MAAWTEEIINNKKKMVKELFTRVNQAGEATNILKGFLKNKLVSIEIKSNNEVTVKTDDGRKFLWNLNDGNSLAKLIRDGEIETVETEFIQSLVKEDWCVFDIGANFGWYSTLIAKHIGLNGQIHSFET